MTTLKQIKMSTNIEFIKGLPATFTRQQLLKIVVRDNGFSISKANSIIEYGLITGLLERVKKGIYKKVEVEIETQDEEGF